MLDSFLRTCGSLLARAGSCRLVDRPGSPVPPPSHTGSGLASRLCDAILAQPRGPLNAERPDAVPRPHPGRLPSCAQGSDRGGPVTLPVTSVGSGAAARAGPGARPVRRNAHAPGRPTAPARHAARERRPAMPMFRVRLLRVRLLPFRLLRVRLWPMRSRRNPRRVAGGPAPPRLPRADAPTRPAAGRPPPTSTPASSARATCGEIGGEIGRLARSVRDRVIVRKSANRSFSWTVRAACPDRRSRLATLSDRRTTSRSSTARSVTSVGNVSS